MRAFSAASKIASAIYRELPAEKKVKGLFRIITGAAMQRLKQGDNKEAVLQALRVTYCTEQRKQQQKVRQVSICHDLFMGWLKDYLFTECLPDGAQHFYEAALSCPPP